MKNDIINLNINEKGNIDMADIQKILKGLTLEEKIGQLFQVNLNTFKETSYEITGAQSETGASREDIDRCGSVLSFSGAKDMLEVQKEYLSKSSSGIPLLFMQDVINGQRTIYPIILGMGATFNPELLKECCEMAAKEASAGGVHVTFSPMLDLVRDARWGRVMESTGEDPYLNSVMAKSYIEGYQGNFEEKHNIAACVKHFAAYGAPEGGRDYNTVDISERNLREYYFPAYKAAIDTGAEMVMTSFNTINGVPASGNEWLMNDILRDEFGFDGILIDDYDACRELIEHRYCADEKEAAEKSVRCNVDIEMMSSTYVNHIKELIEEGKISEEQIDKMVLRVLRLKDKLGLFENPYSYASLEEEKRLFCCKEHRDIARRAAEESIVMLKNDGALPLNKDEKIALIGPFGKTNETIGRWHSLGQYDETVTLYDGIRSYVPEENIYADDTCSFIIEDDDDTNFPRAIEKMKKADKIVLAIGEHQTYSGEGRSRAKIILPKLHTKLVREAKKLGKPIVAVVYCGRPLELEELSELCDSILVVWQPGTEGGNAIANILYGKVNPSGKITMCFPYTVGQCPIYYNHFSTGRPKFEDKLVEDPFVVNFKSEYVDVRNSPLYPFGYGLSYTDFKIDNITLSDNTLSPGGKITVSADIENVGSVYGKEVVQMYICDRVASVVRPVKELKGFEKIGLEPGEKKTVTFEITEDMLRFYNQKMEYVSEAGLFEVMIGNSSENLTVKEFTLAE